MGFNAIGGTRIKLLDNILVLVLLGAVGGPLAHLTLKWLFNRAREKRAREYIRPKRSMHFLKTNSQDKPNHHCSRRTPCTSFMFIPFRSESGTGSMHSVFVMLIATGVQIRYLDLFQLIPFKTAVEVHNIIDLY